MSTKPIPLSEIRKRLVATLDNVKKSNSLGMEKAQIYLQALESNLSIRPAERHHKTLVELVEAARTALSVGRIEDTEMLVWTAIKMTGNISKLIRSTMRCLPLVFAEFRSFLKFSGYGY